MRTRAMLTLIMTIFILTSVCPLAYGQTEGRYTPYFLTAPWKFTVAPYLWLTAMEGGVTVRGRTADVDLDFGDTLELLFDSFKFAALGRVEAQKGELLFTLDLVYLNLEDDETTAVGQETEVTSQLLITEFGAGYRLGTWPLSPNVRPSLSADVLIGGRYVFLDAGLEIAGGPLGRRVDVERDVDWLEPFVGGRLLLALSKRVSFAVRGDAGGFGVGSDFTWNLVGTFQYHVSRTVSLGVGYRALDVDYEQGSGASQVKFDVIIHGPLLGVVFHF